MLHAFVTENRDLLLARCRAKVAHRRVPVPAEAELEFSVPLFLDQLAAALRSPAEANAEMRASARRNGADLRRLGVTVAQVVHCYGDVCQSATELAMERAAPIAADEFRTLNSCIDDAIAAAVTEFESSRDRAVAADELERQTMRYGFLTHGLRDKLNSATLAFGMLRKGTVGLGGSTGALLDRNLRALQALIDRAMVEVRASAGLPVPEQIRVGEFMEEMEVAALLEAQSRGLRLTVQTGEPGLVVEADRLTLTSVVTNLIQNALKYSRPGGHVEVLVHATTERVLIEVRDECGGLPTGRAADLFRPLEQRSADRTGLGLGLALVFEGVQANGGTIHVSDLPGTGCVFTVDFPKAADET